MIMNAILLERLHVVVKYPSNPMSLGNLPMLNHLMPYVVAERLLVRLSTLVFPLRSKMSLRRAVYRNMVLICTKILRAMSICFASDLARVSLLLDVVVMSPVDVCMGVNGSMLFGRIDSVHAHLVASGES